MDPQSNLTETFGLQDPESLLFEALSKRGPLPVVPIQDNLTLTPSSIDLAHGELQFVAETGREFILRRCLERTELGQGTVVIVDSPPTLGVLAVNCLTAASTVVVVVKPGGFEMRALSRLDEVIGELRETGIRPDLSISGVILTEVQARRTINDQVEEELKKLYPVFGRIRSEAKLVYATTEGRITDSPDPTPLTTTSALPSNLESSSHGSEARAEQGPQVGPRRSRSNHRKELR